jgi:hypothetical protein
MARPYNVVTPRKDEKTGKTFWTKIGVAFPRDNGGFSIKLEALPLGAELMIFPPDDRASAPKSDTNGNADDIPY